MRFKNIFSNLNFRAIVSAISILGVCFIAYQSFTTIFYFGNRVVNNSKCMPMLYDTQTDLINIYGEPSSLVKTLNISSMEVLNHYTTTLMPNPNSLQWRFNLDGNWRIEDTSSVTAKGSGTLFLCDNLLESRAIETGCIFVREGEEGHTLIGYSWRVSEISSGCNSKIQSYESN